MADDPPIYGMPQGIITSERIRELVSRYGVLTEYVCRLLSDNKCISYPDPREVVVCEEIF